MIVVVPVDPPHPGFVLPAVVEGTSLTDDEAASLYAAATRDVLAAVASSGGDLLVNYRDESTLPEAVTEGDPEAEVRSLADDAVGSTADVRFERQVGSTRSARIGNTVTHLLERENATAVGVLVPTAPLVGRTAIDGAAMSLRRHDAVFGPTTAGDVYFAGFTEPIDFTGAYEPPSLATLTDRAVEAGLSVGFAPAVATIDHPMGLAETIAGVRSRVSADRLQATETAAVIDEFGLDVGRDGGIVR